MYLEIIHRGYPMISIMSKGLKISPGSQEEAMVGVTQYFFATDDVHLSSIIQGIKSLIVEEEPSLREGKYVK
jgi:hypothetical protein